MLFNKRFWSGALAALIVFILATLQSGHLFGISGIRPNLVLVALIVLAFFIENFGFYAALVLLSCIGIHFAPGLSREAVAFAFIALAGFFLKDRIVWPGISGSAILVFLGTLCLYLIIDLSFIYQHPGIVFFEAVYNIVLGLVFFELLSLYVKKTRLTI